MADELTQRLSVEGADPLLLAGVNDVNLSELERATGARVSLRGDTLTLRYWRGNWWNYRDARYEPRSHEDVMLEITTAIRQHFENRFSTELPQAKTMK